MKTITVDEKDAFMIAAGLLLLMEPEKLTPEELLHSVGRTDQARKLCNEPGRYHRLMKELHQLAFGKPLPYIPPEMTGETEG